MHKKRIKGKAYFYTSYRDKNGKINTKYLGSDERLAKKAEAEFKGLPHNNYWKGLLMILLIIFAVIIFTQTSYITDLILTGASTYRILAPPSVGNTVGVYNSTPNYNMSIFGYGNYSDADFDDSNGTSSYKWFVNGVENQTGTTGQLLLCHFDNNYTCEEGEIANITQYHTEFNTTAEAINVTLTEKNNMLVYFNIPRTAIVTEAFMNISGYNTSNYDLLKYDAILNADYGNPGTSPGGEGYYLAGVVSGRGIDSWFLISNTTNLSGGLTANMLSIYYSNATGTPSNGNFSYNLKICPTQLVKFSQIPSGDIYTPDDNCTSNYVNIVDTVNLSAVFSDDINGGWYNFTFNDNVSITLDLNTNYTLKFEFVDGDLSADRYWQMYLVDGENNGNAPFYVAFNDSTYKVPRGNQQLQFYSKSNNPKGVEVDVCNDNNINFVDDNQAFDTTNTTDDFASEINDTCFTGCSSDYCDIPINVSSNSSGVIGLEALRISYDHYDLDGNFSQGMIANYTYVTKYGSDNNIHNHNGTLDMWVKPYWDGNDGYEHTFFTDNDSIIQLNKSSSGNLVFFVDGSSISCSDSTSWSARVWHLLTATWNQGEKMYLYIDGTSCGSTDAPASISALGDSIFIGSNAENSSQANATIDELRITGFPRSSDEINSYYSENRSFFQNEVFLNSTDQYVVRRDDNITFELTPKHAGGEGSAGISEVIVSNFVPVPPVLITPSNDTYFSLQYAFDWFNGTDYDQDPIYYILQIGTDAFTDLVTFIEPVANYSIVEESSDPTSYFITGVEDGNYSWRVLSSDLTANSSFTDPRVVSLDSTAPNLTLESPTEKFFSMSSSEIEKEIIFYFNVSDFNPLTNCTFNLNSTGEAVINQTIDEINQTENNFTTTLAFGGYNWSINCTDVANNVNSTGLVLSSVDYSVFEGRGRTTNFSTVDDPTNVSSLVIEDPEYGVVNFTEIDVGSGVNLSCVTISSNYIKIDGTCMPRFNTYANLTLFNLTLADTYVQRDGVNCTDCTEIDSSRATYTFSITGAGTYTILGTIVPPVPSAPSSGGHGGGGGTKTLTKRSSFLLSSPGQAELRQFTMQMKQGATFFEKIKIVNTGDLLLLVSFTHNLGNYLSLSQEQVRIEPGEENTVNVKFSALDTGIQVGNIVVTSSDIQKIIPVTLEVSSEKIMVDAKMEVLPEYAELKSGDSLKAQVTLFNTAKKEVPVVVTYVIKDLEGNIVLEESETFDMPDKKSFTKTFDTSKLKAGQYVTGMNVRYLDSFATSSARFEVKGEPVKEPLFEFKWYYVMIIVGLFILVMLLKISSANFRSLLRKKKRELKHYEK